MTSELALKAGRLICRKYKVRYYFGTKNKSQGYSYPWAGFIYVPKDVEDVTFLSTIFHEIQHCLNFRKGKYLVYHTGYMTEKQARRWMLPAEIYTEKMAKKLAEANGFTSYVGFYKNNQASKEFVKNYIDSVIGKVK